MWPSIPRRLLIATLALPCIGAAIVWACGPFFPNRLLLNGDAEVLKAPVADFKLEIMRLRPAGEPAYRLVRPTGDDGDDKLTRDVDLADLRTALGAMNTPRDRAETLLAGYGELRSESQTNAVRAAERDFYKTTLDALPLEFALYLRGAVAYRLGNSEAAVTAWESLLALPAGERRYRSTWASFMLGKLRREGDPERAVEHFRQVRALVQDGFVDSLGLAASSLGWEASAELQRDRFEQAVGLYVRQLATDDPTAVWSLRVVAARVLKDTGLRERAARDALSRRVITAYVLAHGGPRSVVDDNEPLDLPARWLATVERANVPVEEADRLAWAAYQEGKYAVAERWLKVSSPDSAVGHWIRAKLLLRGGKVESAANELAAAIKGFPETEEWPEMNEDDNDGYGTYAPRARAHAELALLKLSRKQYVDSLDHLLNGGYWLDAAYVAERVLTIDELRDYVSKTWPAATPEIENAVLPLEQAPGEDDAAFAQRAEAYWNDEARAAGRARGQMAVEIRHLLARRLVRAGRYADARTFMPLRYQPSLDAYARAVQRGGSRLVAAKERSAALWEAAQLCRSQGMDLMGTELEPDWFALGGSFELGSTTRARIDARKDPLTGRSADERARTHADPTPIDKRWHYRYVAANLAWRAAAEMPDNDDATADVLWEAGSWLKARDPKAADRFYKALATRCAKTDLGREANRLHWFPETPTTQPARKP